MLDNHAFASLTLKAPCPGIFTVMHLQRSNHALHWFIVLVQWCCLLVLYVAMTLCSQICIASLAQSKPTGVAQTALALAMIATKTHVLIAHHNGWISRQAPHGWILTVLTRRSFDAMSIPFISASTSSFRAMRSRSLCAVGPGTHILS